MLKHLRARYPLIIGLLVIFLGTVGGVLLGLYDRFPMLDKYFHVVGGAVAAWFVLSLMQDELTHMHWWKQVLIFVSVTSFVGVAWEWAEYLSSLTRTSTPWLYKYFHGGDIADTLGDLAADTVGALVFTLWALWQERT